MTMLYTVEEIIIWPLADFVGLSIDKEMKCLRTVSFQW